MSNPWSNQLVSLVIVTAPPGQYAGIFVYSPTPGPGNLIGSWAAQAGTDPYGNAYPQGLNVAVGTITGTTFKGTNFIINSSGLFFYSGTPALGNLIAVIAPASGVDSFGNAYSAGITSQENVFGTSTNIFGSGMQFKLPTATPEQVGVNANGLFIYKSPGGALGNLALAATPNSGTDSFGNSYAAGVQINNNLLTVFTGSGGGKTSQTDYFDALIQWEQPVGTLVGTMTMLVTTPNQLIWSIKSTVVGNDNFSARFKAAAANGIPALLALGLDGTLPTIIVANNPTLPDNNPEAWHDLRPLSNSFVGTITNEWPPQYRLMPDGNVEIFGAVQLPASGSYNGITWGTLPAGFRPAKFTYIPCAQLGGAMSTDTTAGSPRLYTDSTGVLQFFGLSPSINSTVVRFSGRFPVYNSPITT